MCFFVKKLFSVSWYGVAGNVGGLRGIVHGAENTILMRGGACAAELRLTGVGVRSRRAMYFVFVSLIFFGISFLLRGEVFFVYLSRS